MSSRRPKRCPSTNSPTRSSCTPSTTSSAGNSRRGARVRASRDHRGRHRTRGVRHRHPLRPQSLARLHHRKDLTYRTVLDAPSRTSPCPGPRTRPPTSSRTSSASCAAARSTARAAVPRRPRSRRPRRSAPSPPGSASLRQGKRVASRPARTPAVPPAGQRAPSAESLGVADGTGVRSRSWYSLGPTSLSSPAPRERPDVHPTPLTLRRADRAGLAPPRGSGRSRTAGAHRSDPAPGPTPRASPGRSTRPRSS